jgi:hypothetical protein
MVHLAGQVAVLMAVQIHFQAVLERRVKVLQVVAHQGHQVQVRVVAEQVPLVQIT